MARYLYEAAARLDSAPTALAARALFGSVRCRWALGEIETLDQGSREACQSEWFPVSARTQAALRLGTLALRRRDIRSATDWFEMILSLENLSLDDSAKARILLAKCKDGEGNTLDALQELDQILEISELTCGPRSRALLLRGHLRYTEGQTQDAINDFSEVISNSPRSGYQAKALEGRSKCYEELGEPELVIQDLTQAVAMRGISPGQAAASVHNYGVRCNLRGQPAKAFEYFSAVPHFDSVTTWIQTNAQVNRGCYLGDTGELKAAIREFKLAQSTPDISNDVLARAIYNLGNARKLQGNYRAAIYQFSKVIERRDMPDVTLAAAHCKRGICWGKLEKFEKAISDFKTASHIPGVETGTIAESLLWLGINFHNMEELDEAQAHFSKLIDMSSASDEMRARAKWGLGDVILDIGDSKRGHELLGEARQNLVDLGRQDLVEILDASAKKRGCDVPS